MTPIVVATNEGLFRIDGSTKIGEIIRVLGKEEAKIILAMILQA